MGSFAPVSRLSINATAFSLFDNSIFSDSFLVCELVFELQPVRKIVSTNKLIMLINFILSYFDKNVSQN